MCKLLNDLKLELSSAIEPEDPDKKINVRGRDVQTGSPGAVDITASEVHAITMTVIKRIAEEVRSFLTELAPEVAGDIFDRGVILTGGGASLEGLPRYLQRELGLRRESCGGSTVCDRAWSVATV